MDHEQKYKEALARAKEMCATPTDKATMEYIFPELKESEDERTRKEIIAIFKGKIPYTSEENAKRYIAWLEKQEEPEDKGEISDGYHTFNELYRYRMLYNAAFFNLLPKGIVHKSKKHHDGEECFGGGWFIVIANLPTGQISNHYELKDWDLFQIPEKEIADEWDGHTPQEAAERLRKYLLEKQGEQKSGGMSIKEKAHQIAWETSKDYDPLLSKEVWCEMAALDMASWLEKQGNQKQSWEPTAAQLIVIKDLIEDKNTSKVNKVILRGMFDELKQFTNSQSSLLSSEYLLDPDKVIEWLECKAFQSWGEDINIKQIVDKFKKDFGL